MKKKILSLLLLLSVMVLVSCSNSTPDPAKTFAFESRNIRLETIAKDSLVASPLEIKGEAKGNMYFEAQFSIKIEDQSGQLLGETTAVATEDWMTDKFVPFTATLEFKKPTMDKGYLILLNDNPSGLPENQIKEEIPVKF